MVDIATKAFTEQKSATHVFVSLKGVPDDVRANIHMSQTSAYSADVWDRSVENPDLHPSSVTIRFSRFYFEDGSRITEASKAHYLRPLKEYLYSMLVDPPSASPKWSTVCGTYHKGIARLLRYMSTHAFEKFSDLGPTDLEDFLESVASEPLKNGCVITDRSLRARVTGLSWLYEQSPKFEDGLNTNPFSEYGSASGWANACCQKQIPRGISRTIEIPDDVACDIFNGALKDLSIADTLNQLFDARRIYKPKRLNKKDTALTSFPWHQFGMSSGADIVKWESRLATACYIIIAMLTGMRSHEILSLRSGDGEAAWIEEEIVHEELKRKFYFVIGRTNKLQAEPIEYKWQTLPITKIAIDAANVGLARRRGDGRFLFPSRSVNNTRFSSTALGSNLVKFIKNHDIFHAGHLWPLASHQFRKKFARIMTRQGLGLRALQDQLKHFDIEMTRCYGDLNLYVELQQEKFQISHEQYEEIMRGQKNYVGGGATEIHKLQKQFLGMAKSQQENFLADLPRSALIEQLDDGLCLYRSKHALCSGDVAACRPADCNNALISIAGKKKSFQWRRSENVRLLKFFCDDNAKVSYLTDRNIQLEKLLTQIAEVEMDKDER